MTHLYVEYHDIIMLKKYFLYVIKKNYKNKKIGISVTYVKLGAAGL